MEFGSQALQGVGGIECFGVRAGKSMHGIGGDGGAPIGHNGGKLREVHDGV